ncbi:hypothetical protein HRE53_12480 [Acaryochloris sp. 'Moss Beach']|uniref:AbrB/MazE/SpoVT family DNA-binding domain-containing protein n=1 Tax=Acaryochloris sp. 'Moss Beach' TaxID=2740837 RepID=UPI001F3E11B5|nr:hypothetical protein [Acaryochloris sp. 'Moss Beach']UJB71695.1 hypothetical protein HRE53_12480 [Acaryochloris sp. 'Moss Beach']
MMKAKVTQQGVLIPKQLLGDVDEVEIRKEQNHIVVAPVSSTDPILELGQHPIDDDISDASINHDRYLHR